MRFTIRELILEPEYLEILYPFQCITRTGVTHPDVIYFPGGKDGYEYWMVYTPYPSEPQENPSIVRSHDGITWTDAGITNPVIPAGTQVHGMMRKTLILILFYDVLVTINGLWYGMAVTCNQQQKIALACSDDGKTWTQYNGSPVNGNANPVILSGTDNNGATWERVNTDPVSKTATSTLFYKDGTFYLFYAEEASGNNRGKIGLATFTWNNQQTVLWVLHVMPGIQSLICLKMPFSNQAVDILIFPKTKLKYLSYVCC